MDSCGVIAFQGVMPFTDISPTPDEPGRGKSLKPLRLLLAAPYRPYNLLDEQKIGI